MARRRRNSEPLQKSASPTISAIARRIALQAPRDPDRSLGRFVSSLARQSEMSHRRLGDAVDQWLAHVPPELASVSRIDAIRGGTLHVVVASPSHLWSLDRLLRGGLTDTLVCAIGPPIQRIRLRIGPLDPTPDPNAAERDARRIPPAR